MSFSKNLLILMAVGLFVDQTVKAGDCCSKKKKKVKNEGLTLRLISDRVEVVPGEKFRVGLSIKHNESYHTYWKNSGVVGIPTSLEWKLPEGFSVSSLRWPYPALVLMAGIRCYGYKRDVVLISDIKVSSSLKVGQQVELKADATWMCCSQQCHPGFKEYFVKIKIGESSVINEQNNALIDQFEKEVPKRNHFYSAEVVSPKSSPKIKGKIFNLKEELKVTRIFSLDGQHTPDLPIKLNYKKDGSVVFEAQRSEFSPKSKENFPFILQSGNDFFHVVAEKKKMMEEGVSNEK